MMSVELGLANEYIRQLSVNTARGLRQKERQGIYPGLAPLGLKLSETGLNMLQYWMK